jgi:hypothetical protein
MHSGQPASNAGQVFVAIHEGSWRNQAQDIDYLDEVFTINVTVSVKAGTIPLAQWGELVETDQDGGLDYILRRIIGIVHGDYVHIFAAANKNLVGGNSQFYKPPGFTHAENPIARGSSWWGAKGATDDGYAGVSQMAVFADIRRLQKDAELPDAG